MAQGLRHLQFSCTRCGNCCRRFRVPLTDRDLSRLLVATSVSAAGLVEWLAPDAVDMTGEPESFVELPEGRRLMVLRWQEGGCSLLDEQQVHEQLCSVHRDSPLSCRLYPFNVTPGRRGGIHRLRMLDLTDCDYERGKAASAQAVAALARQQQSELANYAVRVSAFNRLQKHRARLGLALHRADFFLSWLLGGAPNQEEHEPRRGEIRATQGEPAPLGCGSGKP